MGTVTETVRPVLVMSSPPAPTDVAGLIGRYKASELGLADQAAVTAVADRSVKGHDLTTPSGDPTFYADAQSPKVTQLQDFSAGGPSTYVQALTVYNGEVWVVVRDDSTAPANGDNNEIWRFTAAGVGTRVVNLGTTRAQLHNWNGTLMATYFVPPSGGTTWQQWNGSSFVSLGSVTGLGASAEISGLFTDSGSGRLLAVDTASGIYWRSSTGTQGTEAGGSAAPDFGAERFGAIINLAEHSSWLYAVTNQPVKVWRRPVGSTTNNWVKVKDSGGTNSTFAKCYLGTLGSSLYLFGSVNESALAMAGVHKLTNVGAGTLTQLNDGTAFPTGTDFNGLLAWGAREYDGHLYVGDRRSGRLFKLILNGDGSFNDLISYIYVGGEDVFPGPIVGSELWLGTFGKTPAVALNPGLYKLNTRSIGRPFPVVHHDGVDDYLQLVWTQAQPVEVFMVGRKWQHQEGGQQYLLDGGDNQMNVYADGLTIFAGGTGDLVATAPAGWQPTEFKLYNYAFNGASSKVRIDGVTLATGSGTVPGMLAPGGITVGAFKNGTSFAQLEWAEILVYERELAASERSWIGAYVKSEYA